MGLVVVLMIIVLTITSSLVYLRSFITTVTLWYHYVAIDLYYNWGAGADPGGGGGEGGRSEGAQAPPKLPKINYLLFNIVD